jgi:hypothetical protein
MPLGGVKHLEVLLSAVKAGGTNFARGGKHLNLIQLGGRLQD